MILFLKQFNDFEHFVLLVVGPRATHAVPQVTRLKMSYRMLLLIKIAMKMFVFNITRNTNL